MKYRNVTVQRKTMNAMQENPTIICDNCGKPGAKLRHLSRSYGKGDTLLVIETVPVIRCPHCGESYLTAEVLHEFQRITPPLVGALS